MSSRTHTVAKSPSWFGYWRDDGFIKSKHLGRIDQEHRWPAIREQWLADFRGLLEVRGRCVKKTVTAEDEWCAEAYMETDYTTLTEADFTAELKRYALFRLSRDERPEPDESDDDDAE